MYIFNIAIMHMERRHDDWYSGLLRWTFPSFGVLGLMQRSCLRSPPSRLFERMGGKHTEDWQERNAFELWLGINGIVTTGDRATRRLINTALVTI